MPTSASKCSNRGFAVLLAATGLLLMLGTAARAHEHPPGPEALEGELGVVHFENSGSAVAQAPFLRGLLLLHSFEYAAARLSFLSAQQSDPQFVMAVWGEALTYNHSLWNEQDTSAARAALAKLGANSDERIARGPTQRERDYLASVEKLYGSGDKAARNASYSEALHALSQRYPDDLDARALYALSLLALSPDRDHATYMRAAAEAEAVYDVEKRHPGALHYMIHAYDDPVHAPLGLRAARLYAQVAPVAPHARHMTSHIFFALGLWDEAIDANEASLRIARAHGDPNYHALLWLEYADLQRDKRDAAEQLIRSVEADVTAHATKDNRLRLAFARATWLIETRGAAGVLADAPVDSTGIASIGYFAVHDFARGIVAAQAGDLVAARSALRSLRHRCDDAKPQPPDDNPVWYDAMTPNELAESRTLETALQGTIDFYGGKRAAGVKRVQAAIEATVHFAFEFGPPWAAKPLQELLGELLLAAGRYREADEAFQKTLAEYPNRRLALEGAANAHSHR